MAVKVGELEARLTLDDKDFSDGMERSSGRSESFVSKLGAVMLKAGVAAAAALGTAAVAVGKMSMDFEAAMTNVGTLLGKEGSGRVKELGEDVKRLAIETGKPLDDLASGVYQVISAWGDSADSAKLLEIAAKSSAAGLATTEDAVNMLSSVTKGYGNTSAEAVQQVADLAFQTANLGQTTFPELAQSMGKVVPLAATAGVKITELFGAVATLTGVTGNTAEVNTQLRATMQALLAPSADMGAALNKMGFDSGQAAIQSLGLQGTLDALAKQTGGNTAELSKMFGSVEALNAVLALTGAQSADFTAKTKAMTEASGVSTEAFNIQQQSVAAMLGKVKAQIQVVAVELGEQFLPLLRDLLKWVIDHMPEIKEFFGTAFEYVRIAIKLVVEAFHWLQGIFNEFVAGWKGGNTEVSGVMGETGSRIHSIMESIMAIIKTVWEAVSAFWSKHGDTILALTRVIWETILFVIDNTLKFISGILDVFIGFITGDWDQLGQGLKSMWEATWQMLVDILRMFGQILWNSLDSNIQGIFIRMGQMAKDAYTWGVNIMRGLSEGLTSMFDRIWGEVTDFVKSIGDKVRSVLHISSPSRVFMEIGQNIGYGLIEGMDRTQPDVHKAADRLAPTGAGGDSSSSLYGGGGGNVTIPIYLDGQMIAQHVVDKAFGNVRQLSRALG